MSATLNDDVLAQLETPKTRSEIPTRNGGQPTRILLVAVDGDGRRLFELQSLFILRLHRASDDFGATEGLRVVESAIAIVIAEAVVKA